MSEANSSLGDRLLEGVLNLWKRVHALESDNGKNSKVLAQQGLDIEEIRRELATLRREIQGLRVSRGRARAKNARLEQQLAEADRLLAETERRVH